MDKDRIDGRAKEVKGSIREAIGKLTGNNKVRAEGVAEKTAGKAQATAGGLKDRFRGILGK